MYRQPYGKSFRYTCGLYQQSHGEQCNHNHVDGPSAARFVLACVRQRLLSPSLLPKLKRRLRDLAGQVRCQNRGHEVKAGTQSALQQLREEIKLAERNLAFASNQESFKSIEGVIAELKERENALATEMQAAELRSNDGSDPDQQIEAALAFADRLSELASDGDNFALAQIQARPKKRRTVNQVCGGVVTLGTAASPIDLYSGPDKSQ
jgi:hypothetical protein